MRKYKKSTPNACPGLHFVDRPQDVVWVPHKLTERQQECQDPLVSREQRLVGFLSALLLFCGQFICTQLVFFTETGSQIIFGSCKYMRLVHVIFNWILYMYYSVLIHKTDSDYLVRKSVELFARPIVSKCCFCLLSKDFPIDLKDKQATESLTLERIDGNL